MLEENALKQKARAKWIKLGDANNKYFSSVIKERNNKKSIRSLMSLDGRMLHEPQEIQNEFVLFYRSLMGTAADRLPAINTQVMKRGPILSRQHRIQLCATITYQEIVEALKFIGSDKAPGIDGYNALFFKHTWKIIEHDVIDVVKSFFNTGNLFKSFNCTLVSLIPKVQSPKSVKEFRPIACCTVMYKIISKVITQRMHEVIHTIISDSQAGFIPGRKIGDNIILAHELVKAYTRKNVSPMSMLKIDLQKAYDSVEWPFLEQVMEGLGFPDLFTQWVMKCVKTVNYTIVVNGQNTQRFDAAKGLRQGDPMSPFLFTIAMEYLSRLLKGLKEEKNFKYHPKCAKLDVTHLCFADDLLLFSRGDLNSIKELHKCFTEFSQASGLQANLNKSSIYCGGVQKEVRQQIVQQLGYTIEELPFKYLGVSLSSKKLNTIQWYPLIDKIMARINSWTAKKLSYERRAQLVKTVLFGVQAY